MVGINVSVDASRIQARLKRLESTIKRGSKTSVKKVADWTRDNIQLNMPKATGESARSIVSITRFERKDEPTAIVTQNFIPHEERMMKGKTYYGGIFNLPFWMFTSANATNHFRSGNINLMRRVPAMARQRFRQDVELMLTTATK